MGEDRKDWPDVLSGDGAADERWAALVAADVAVTSRERRAHGLPALELRPGMRVRHYKGGLYEVLAPAARPESGGRPLVAYRSLAGGAVWVRPLREFLGVTGGVERFAAAGGDQ